MHKNPIKTRKQNSSVFLLVLIYAFVLSPNWISLSACAPQGTAKSAPTIAPIETQTPTLAVPTDTPPPTPVLMNPPVSYNQAFLNALGTSQDSCLPDQTAQHVGVYIYNLDTDQELVSINADTPFQFASAFKAPVLTDFLSNCKQYWDVDSPAWDAYFRADTPLHQYDWYLSETYRQRLAAQIANVQNWKTIETFAFNNRAVINNEAGPLDKRYFILNQVYSMVTESSNPAAGNVLNFVFQQCLTESDYHIEQSCGGPNAITEFNAWFNQFSGVNYSEGEKRRGLYSWDNLVDSSGDGGPQIQQMPTSGLTDLCALQAANLSCTSDLTAVNTYTPRDLFKFYYALFHLNDEPVRNTSLDILGIMPNSLSRGYLKNMASEMGIRSFSKNGRAFYSYGPIVTDAGILQYQGHSYVIVTLSYNTVESIEKLYGQYMQSGIPMGTTKGLIQQLLEGQLAPDG